MISHYFSWQPYRNFLLHYIYFLYVCVVCVVKSHSGLSAHFTGFFGVCSSPLSTRKGAMCFAHSS